MKTKKVNFKTKPIQFEDDIVVVMFNGKEIYKGPVDDDPMDGEDWRFDRASMKYTLTTSRGVFEKYCLDI